MLTIRIPKPCHEDWQKMTPTSLGAFCKSCRKEVIDFTKMNDEEVTHYLLNRNNEKLCGRFKQQQIDRIKISLPSNIFSRRMASWKKFMAIVLLAFSTTLIGCDVILNRNTKGEVLVKLQPNTITGDTIYTTTGVPIIPIEEPKVDTTKCSNILMGKLKAPKEPVTGTIKFIKPDSVPIDSFFNGEK